MNILRGKGRKLRTAGTLLVAAAVLQASCGTILHPERRGQPAGRLDIGVVALDGIGLLLFLVPGVIAFAVDFATGAIYLPPEYSHAGPLPGTSPREVRIEPAELSPQRVETIVREQTGKTVTLQPGGYRAMRLQKLDEFTPRTVAELEASANPANVNFRGSDE
ncbi:MAG: hypothetical protein L0Y71_07955 [Gemmataceae bacterium]|nr:hypothetical protein [Gemmataceae bacterium]